MIQQSLTGLSENRETIVIARRLATVRNANQVFVVTSKGIEEQETYDELVARGGILAQTCIKYR